MDMKASGNLVLDLETRSVGATDADADDAKADPLLGVKAKTSWYPAARPGWRGRRRILGPGMYEVNHYHVMSRTCGGAVFFDDLEKEALKRVLWRVAAFCGVGVLTYCVMGNHFHVLVAVPHRETWLQRFEGAEGERRLLRHLRTLYSKSYLEQLESEIREWRRLGMESMVTAKLESFKRRMGDLSRFVKEVKERFSRWYNKRHERKGTLWMDRFKSVLIEGNVGLRGEREADRVDVVKAMAAYIDLNPVRAGLVADAREYAWSGYGEACAGEKRAQRGLCRVLGQTTESEKEGCEAQEVEVQKAYANLLLGVDWETGKRRKEKDKDEDEEKVEPRKRRSGKESKTLSTRMSELLKRRVRAFSESVVLGSMAFVEEVFQANRECFGAKRKKGALRMTESEAPIYVARRKSNSGS